MFRIILEKQKRIQLNFQYYYKISAPLSPARPSRIFSVHKPLEDPVAQEIKDLREARAQRLAKIYASDDDKTTDEVENKLKAKKQKEEARLAEER